MSNINSRYVPGCSVFTVQWNVDYPNANYPNSGLANRVTRLLTQHIFFLKILILIIISTLVMVCIEYKHEGGCLDNHSIVYIDL